MNLTILLTVVAIFQVSASGFAQKISLSEKKAPLNQVFKRISEQTGYDFLISTESLKMANAVTIHVENEELGNALDQIFKSQPLAFVIQDKTVIVSVKDRPAITQPKPPAVPTIHLKGTISDSTGRPLNGATVKVKGRQAMTLSDQDGKFELDVLEGDELTVSYIGLRSYIFIASVKTSSLKIILTPSTGLLSDVTIVSTGYQNVPKERATGSFNLVDNRALNRRVSPDILSRLEGAVPGLLFNRNALSSGGGNADISIRGVSTINAQRAPLIILDGFPYDGDLNNINPNAIENISILKDAAAASIWGVRSGNGVIVLTTKKGLKNQPNLIEFNSNVTVGEKPDLNYNRNFLNANDFINYEQQLFAKGYFDDDLNTGYLAVSPVVGILNKERNGQLSSTEAAAQLNAWRGIDVRKELRKYFYQRSVNQQYNLSLKGGNSGSDYFVSLGFDNDKSALTGNANKRFTINSNLNFYPVKDLTISMGINYSQTAARFNNTLGQINGGDSKSGIYPYAQLMSADGRSLPIVKDYAAQFTDTVGAGRYYDWKYRPLDELHNSDNTSSQTENRLNFSVGYRILPGLNAEVKYQYQRQQFQGSNYFNENSYYTRDLINQFTQGYPSTDLTYVIPQGGILQSSTNSLNSHRGRLQLNYDRALGDHQITGVAGIELSSAVTASNSNTAYGYSKTNETASTFNGIDFFQRYPTLTYTQVPNSLGFGKFTDHFLSYFANGSYTFRQRYIISVSGRIDQSNLFGVNTNQKGVPLYSVGAAWVFTQEPMFQSKSLDYGKLRLTYGYNGNVDKSVAAFTTQKQIGGIGNYYYGVPFLVVDKPGNPDLRWEKIRNINLGLDFSLIDHLISGSLEVYFKKGTDLLGDVQLAPSSGFVRYRGNFANIKGSGIDLTLNAAILRNKAFSWSATLLMSKEQNEVTRYDVKQPVNSYLLSGSGNGTNVIPLEGRPLYAIYSYQWAGLDHNTGDPQGYLNGQISKDYAAIINGTTTDQLDYNGPARPTLYGSMRHTFGWRSFELSFNLIYKFNYYFRRSSISYGTLAQSWIGHADFANRWQQPGDEAFTQTPSAAFPPFDSGRDNFYQYSSSLVDKGDHIRLQDINLAYTFDRLHLKKFPFRRLQIYAYVNNVGLLWRANKDHLDPDLYSIGPSSALPLPRTYAIGLKSNF